MQPLQLRVYPVCYNNKVAQVGQAIKNIFNVFKRNNVCFKEDIRDYNAKDFHQTFCNGCLRDKCFSCELHCSLQRYRVPSLTQPEQVEM